MTAENQGHKDGLFATAFAGSPTGSGLVWSSPRQDPGSSLVDELRQRLTGGPRRRLSM
jgi:hypothetical protein